MLIIKINKYLDQINQYSNLTSMVRLAIGSWRISSFKLMFKKKNIFNVTILYLK